jgi:biotin synthase
MNIQNILQKENLSKEDLVYLLTCTGEEEKELFKYSKSIREKEIGKGVYLRGLIEFSNICKKDCLYCGIRKSNTLVDRFNIEDKHILNAAKFAYDNKYGSLVLQGGERDDDEFVERIDNLLKEIKKLSNGKLGITLSVGEQTKETYERWFLSGAHRYLLRIESSNKDLYYKIHPNDENHSFEKRINCLNILREVGYQVGTGVMIGLPHQTTEDLANDLLFFKKINVDMIGMGPYIEHTDTPLYADKDLLMPLKDRFTLALHMVSCLRIIMKDINIAAATALQAIDPIGREKAINIGANIIMPNITPTDERVLYQLYQNKPCTDEGADECYSCIEKRIQMANCEVKYNEWGDSLHYKKRAKH